MYGLDRIYPRQFFSSQFSIVLFEILPTASVTLLVSQKVATSAILQPASLKYTLLIPDVRQSRRRALITFASTGIL
jgi:hypothetical protein